MSTHDGKETAWQIFDVPDVEGALASWRAPPGGDGAATRAPVPADEAARRRRRKWASQAKRQAAPQLQGGRYDRPDPLADILGASRLATRATWPFELHAARIKGRMLHYADAGTGPALVFLNPPFPSLLWREVLVGLCDEFRCLAVDLPGTGLSERIPTGLQTLADEARYLAGFLDALGLEELTLVFHDLGGLIGLTALADRPERVRALVAVNTFAWSHQSPHLRAMLRLMGSALMRELNAVTGFLPRALASRFGGGRHLHRGVRHALRQSMHRPADRRVFHRLARSALEDVELADRAEGVLRGPLADRPVLTIFGQRNDYFGFQRHWRKLFPHARQVVVPRGNHFPMRDAPDLVASSIRAFWRDQVEGGVPVAMSPGSGLSSTPVRTRHQERGTCGDKGCHDLGRWSGSGTSRP